MSWRGVTVSLLSSPENTSMSVDRLTQLLCENSLHLRSCICHFLTVCCEHLVWFLITLLEHSLVPLSLYLNTCSFLLAHFAHSSVVVMLIDFLRWEIFSVGCLNPIYRSSWLNERCGMIRSNINPLSSKNPSAFTSLVILHIFLATQKILVLNVHIK
jgi:hypothetical protein